jgi:hypothetical protein
MHDDHRLLLLYGLIAVATGLVALVVITAIAPPWPWFRVVIVW